jgi:hypothetical protein
MGVEQKLGAYKALFPHAEVKNVGQRLLVRHNLDRVRSKLDQRYNAPMYAQQLAKTIYNLGEGFDYVFTAVKPSSTRKDATEFPDTHYVSVVANDGAVHQMKTMDQQFPDLFSAATLQLETEKPIVFVDGFVNVNNRGGADYYMTPKNDPNERVSASKQWVEIFKKVFWLSQREISGDINISISLADPADKDSLTVLTASYDNDNLSIAMDGESVETLAESLRKPFRGMTMFRDIRNTQTILPSFKNPLADF